MTNFVEPGRQGPLGTAQEYTAVVHMQGGQQLFTAIEGATTISWGRKLDDYSEASVTVAKADAGAACCGRLGQVHTWGHELSIYRDGVFVWQGPVVNKIETSAEFVIEARDVLAYLDRRPALGIYNWAPADDQNTTGEGTRDSGYIASQVMRDSLGRPSGHGKVDDPRLDPNLWEHAIYSNNSGVQATLQQFLLGENYAADVMRDMAEYGLDLYAMARHICMIPTAWKREWRPLRLTEHDFLDDLELRENGLDAATLAVVVGTQPQNPIDNNTGTQPPSDKPKPVASWPNYTGPGSWAPRDPVDPFYGFVGQTGSSQSATTNAQCASLAQQVVQYGRPAPISVVVPDGAKLSPTVNVGIQQLVPGYPILLALDTYCSPVQQQRFELNELEVDVSLSGEAMTEVVKVSLASGPTPLDSWQGGSP